MTVLRSSRALARSAKHRHTMCAKAMTFSDMGWGKVIEGAVKFYNEQWARAFLMGKVLSSLKVKVRFNKKRYCQLCIWGI